MPTFALEELIATKIRALFQRKKGRDLFDLWLAVERGGLAPASIAECFGPYRPDGWTVERALANLDEKLADRRFATDLDPLVVDRPDGYTPDTGARIVQLVLEAIETGSR